MTSSAPPTSLPTWMENKRFPCREPQSAKPFRMSVKHYFDSLQHDSTVGLYFSSCAWVLFEHAWVSIRVQRCSYESACSCAWLFVCMCVGIRGCSCACAWVPSTFVRRKPFSLKPLPEPATPPASPSPHWRVAATDPKQECERKPTVRLDADYRCSTW